MKYLESVIPLHGVIAIGILFLIQISTIPNNIEL